MKILEPLREMAHKTLARTKDRMRVAFKVSAHVEEPQNVRVRKLGPREVREHGHFTKHISQC